jgi:uncharacterized coiled-coil protein SlyX
MCCRSGVKDLVNGRVSVPREVLTVSVDGSREPADNDEAGRRSADGFIGQESDRRAAPERAMQLPTAAERMEARRHARRAVDDAYAARDGEADGTCRELADSNPRAGETPRTASEPGGERNVVSSDNAVDVGAFSVDVLQKRVSELEADKVGQERRIAALDKKIAEQVGTIAELRAAKDEQGRRIDLLAAAVGDLGERREDQRAGERIERRVNHGPGADVERAEREPRRLPTDAVNNVVSAVAGGAITDLAYHLKELPPEYAGLAATGLTVAAGAVAVWRERRKAKDDADYRPEG